MTLTLLIFHTHLALMTTQNLSSLKEYLLEQGLTEADEATLKYAKLAYAKQYHKQYHARYVQEKKQLKITLSLHEYARLQKRAEQRSQKLAPFAREAMLAYLNQSFLLPDDSSLSVLTVAFGKIGNNINQIAHHTNALKSLTYGNFKQLREELNALEQAVQQALNNPPPLLEIVAQELQKNPSLLPQLEALLVSVRSNPEDS